jgi:hypothetical protein
MREERAMELEGLKATRREHQRGLERDREAREQEV